MVASMTVRYAIDFVAIHRYEIHDRAFEEITNLPFPCMIQRHCDEVSVPAIPRVDERVLAMVTTQTKSMKDLAHPGLSRRCKEPSIVPQVQTEGPLVSINPSDGHESNMGISVDKEIRDKR